MRTTITIDPDVAARLEAVQRERGWTFKEAVNAMLRRGLGATGDGESPYRMPVRALGVRSEVDIDRIREEIGRLDDARVDRSAPPS